MECRKYQEHITAAVDNALEADERDKLEAHLALCPVCRSELEIEQLTRSFIKTRCHRKHAPGSVMQRISQQLEAESRGSHQASWWERVRMPFYVRPAIAFALACVAVIVVLNNNDTFKSPRVIEASILPANDIIKQSLANHLAVLQGAIKPQFESNLAENVQGFFIGKTEFPVLIPKMSDCTLRGGVLNEFGGTALAHVLYDYNNSEVIYLYETCWETLQKGAPLHLAQDVQEELRRTNWYATTTPDGRSVVMWRNGNTLCSAVSKLDQATLKACLSTAE